MEEIMIVCGWRKSVGCVIIDYDITLSMIYEATPLYASIINDIMIRQNN